MDLSNFIPATNQNNSIIQDGIDPEKHAKIVATLCAKRKALDDKLADPTSVTREDDAITLMQLKQDMSLFGISEIDYQAHLMKMTVKPETPTTEVASVIPAPLAPEIGGSEEEFLKD